MSFIVHTPPMMHIIILLPPIHRIPCRHAQRTPFSAPTGGPVQRSLPAPRPPPAHLPILGSHYWYQHRHPTPLGSLPDPLLPVKNKTPSDQHHILIPPPTGCLVPSYLAWVHSLLDFTSMNSIKNISGSMITIPWQPHLVSSFIHVSSGPTATFYMKSHGLPLSL